MTLSFIVELVAGVNVWYDGGSVTKRNAEMVIVVQMIAEVQAKQSLIIEEVGSPKRGWFRFQVAQGV